MDDRQLEALNASDDEPLIRLPQRHPWLNRKRRAMLKARQVEVDSQTPERASAPAAQPKIIVKRKRHWLLPDWSRLDSPPV